MDYHAERTGCRMRATEKELVELRKLSRLSKS